MKTIRKKRGRHGTWALALASSSPAYAAPIEGETSSNAAALLVLLGVGALVMGLRNLRELRHKRLAPNRQFPEGRDQDPDE